LKHSDDARFESNADSTNHILPQPLLAMVNALNSKKSIVAKRPSNSSQEDKKRENINEDPDQPPKNPRLHGYLEISCFRGGICAELSANIEHPTSK
jgi:hypothetical protein